MKIVVSACLLGENCKYSGGNNKNEALLRFLEGHEVIPVCPEVMGGLPVPRERAEISGGTVVTESGKDVTKEYFFGAAKALEVFESSGADMAVLQSRSPSCGLGVIYDGSFSGVKIPGNGVFAEMLVKKKHAVMDAAEFKNRTDR